MFVLQFVSDFPVDKMSVLVQVMGLAPVQCEAITRTNADPTN